MRSQAMLIALLVIAVAIGQCIGHREALQTAPVSGAAVVGRKGVVTCASAPASEVGIRTLRSGGNAVDAAVAMGLALAVTYPAAGNIGGGGFMVLRMKDGRTAALDFREVAPAAAVRDMYLDSRGELVPRASTEGHRAAGVPGTVAGFALARDRFGRLPWKSLVEPARALAADGFPLSQNLARDLRSAGVLARFPESRRIFQRDGDYYRAGDVFKQPDLAETLARIRDRGPREFYEGETARRIAADMESNGGLITLQDLRSYKALFRNPMRGTYRGCEIISMPPPSSGGIALVQMLNMLENLPREKDAGQAAHCSLEVMKRAFADRARYLGDPDFVRVPWQELTSKSYAKRLAAMIDPRKSTPGTAIGPGLPETRESLQTTHYSVVDSAGSAVAVTYTLNSGFGSGATARGTGILLNNEMDDFVSKVGAPNQFGLIQGEANAIAPRKRPLSSMMPTLVLKDGRLFLVLGSPGGPTIINTVLQVVTNVIDRGLTLEEAVRAPRIHHQWMPDSVTYEAALPDAVRSKLRALNHLLDARPRSMGDVQAIHVNTAGERRAVSDPRSPDGRALAE